MDRRRRREARGRGDRGESGRGEQRERRRHRRRRGSCRGRGGALRVLRHRRRRRRWRRSGVEGLPTPHGSGSFEGSGDEGEREETVERGTVAIDADERRERGDDAYRDSEPCRAETKCEGMEA